MPPRVLFVDDEESVHFAMREFLGTRGYRVDSARDAAQARALVARSAYDVVIADLRLGEAGTSSDELEGLALVDHLHREHPSTRVVVLTACWSELEGEALRRGADRFLQKPQPLGRLADIVGALCEGRP